jgi:hypothetical protein
MLPDPPDVLSTIRFQNHWTKLPTWKSDKATLKRFDSPRLLCCAIADDRDIRMFNNSLARIDGNADFVSLHSAETDVIEDAPIRLSRSACTSSRRGAGTAERTSSPFFGFQTNAIGRPVVECGQTLVTDLKTEALDRRNFRRCLRRLSMIVRSRHVPPRGVPCGGGSAPKQKREREKETRNPRRALRHRHPEWLTLRP